MTMRLLAVSFIFITLTGMPFGGYTQTWQWLTSTGGVLGDDLNGLAVGENGISWISGTFRGTVDNGFQAITSTGERDVFLCKLNGSGVPEWLLRAGSDDDDTNGGVATDALGNAYIAGRYWDEADFGGLTISRDNGSNSAIYLAKYDQNGNAEWAKSIDGGGLKVVRDIVCDPSGNVLLTGYFSDTLFTDEEPLVAQSNSNVFALKFDPSGNLQWSRRAGILRDVRGSSIAADPAGNVYVGGSFEGELLFAGDVLSTATVDNDVFLLKYSPAGNELWAKRGGGVHGDNCNAIAVGEDGHVYLTGNFIGVLKFDDVEVQSPGFNDHLFITKINGAGEVQWSKAYGATDDEYGLDIDAGQSQLVISGYFRGVTDIDGTVLTTDPVVTDGFLGIFDLSGNLQSIEQLEGEGFGLGVKTSILPSGNMMFAGIYENEGTLDGLTTISAGGYDAFTARLNLTTPTENIIQDEFTVSVFPNPAADLLNLENQSGQNLKSVKIEIINAIGATVYRNAYGHLHSGGSRKIDVRHLSSGLYILKFFSEDRRAAIKFLKL